MTTLQIGAYAEGKKAGFDEDIEEIKKFILKNQKMYTDNKRHSIAKAMKLLILDITYNYQYEWTTGEFKNESHN